MEYNSLKILAIDDSLDNLIALRAVVSDVLPGATVHTAHNGPEGIALARAKDPDVILLDILMPDMDGYAVCRALKKDHVLRQIPVIILTALQSDEVRRARALEAGAEGFLTKPLDSVELTAQIRAMAKIKAASQKERLQREQLSAMVAERTRELEQELRERMLAERALRDSEDKFKYIFESANVGKSITFPTGEIAVNKAFADMLGYTPEELRHRSWRELTPAEEIEPLNEILELLLEGERASARFDKRYIRRDGSFVWADVSVAVRRDAQGAPLYFIATIVDITGRKLAEEEVIRSEAYIKTVMDNLPLGIAVNSVDPVVTFDYMNDRFPALYRTTREALSDPDAFWDSVYEDPEFRAKIKKQVLDDCASGDPERMHWEDVPIVRRGSETTYITARDTPVPGSPLMISTVQDVTARKRAEDLLRENERQLATLLSNLPGMAYRCRHDWKSTMEFVSDGALALTGYTPSELVGNRVVAYADLIHPEDRAAIWNQAEASLERREPFVVVYRLRTAAGEERWMWEQGQGIFDEQGHLLALEGFVSDITENKRAEEALRKQAERLQNLHRTDQAILRAIESPEEIARLALQYLRELLACRVASVGVFEVKEKRLRVLAVDSADTSKVTRGARMAEEAYGSPESLYRGEMVVVEDSSGLTSHPAMSHLLEAEGTRSCMNMPIRTARGALGVLHIGWTNARIITAEEKQIAAEVADQIAIAIEQARLVHETRRYSAELERRVAERTAQLEAANQELEAFSYSVSHDLRAPLRAMEGFSAALLSGYGDRLDEQGRHYLERIQEGARRLGELITNILDLSRITRTELAHQSLDFGALANEIAAELMGSHPQRRVMFVVAEQMRVQGDEHLLRIALRNLIENAWKFSSRCENATIEIGRMTLVEYKTLDEGWGSHLAAAETSAERTDVYFVRDNGVGFEMAYADKLFAPFQRLHAMHEFPGTGIGLATVKRVINRHGGSIWASAREGQGATFYFTLGGT